MDISILYYTANLIPQFFAVNVRNHLLEVTKGEIPIISISQVPIDFGENIYIPDISPSIYNVYKQILIGAKSAKTKYLVCCEDDSLYTSEHFRFRPQEDAFCYNVNRWRVHNDAFLFKHRREATAAGMWNCIAPTELMIKTLGARFEKYPVRGSQIGWGEPGRYERKLGLPPVKSLAFRTEIPNITFSHETGLGGVRRIGPEDIRQKELPYWGSAKELRERMWNGIG